MIVCVCILDCVFSELTICGTEISLRINKVRFYLIEKRAMGVFSILKIFCCPSKVHMLQKLILLY